MDARTLLLRKLDVDTTLVSRSPDAPHAGGALISNGAGVGGGGNGGGSGAGNGHTMTYRLGFHLVPGTKRTVRMTSQDTAPATPPWPSHTSLLCWHCCHSFETTPLPMPVEHDDRRDTFRVMGVFCSWACMKTYNSSSSSYLKHTRAMLITLFRKRCTGALGRLENNTLVNHIVPAPPRSMLKAFGGTMTIEEFRAASHDGRTYRFLPPKLVMHDPLVEETRGCTTKPAADLAASVSFAKTTQKNETLRLKRHKPLATHNMLQRTMGLLVD